MLILRRTKKLQTELSHSSPQVLQAFEEIPIFSVLEQIKEKHNLEKVKKVSELIAVLADSRFNFLCSLTVWSLDTVALGFLLRETSTMK